MTLSQSTLKAGLEDMGPVATEAQAIDGLVAAWSDYFYESEVSGKPCVAGTLSAPLGALALGLVGMGVPVPGVSAAAIAVGISAFWSALSATALTNWLTTPIVLVPPVTPPTLLAGLGPALQAAFTANAASGASLPASASAVASVLHSSAGLGGLIPGSVPPATPVPIPIL